MTDPRITQIIETLERKYQEVIDAHTTWLTTDVVGERFIRLNREFKTALTAARTLAAEGAAQAAAPAHVSVARAGDFYAVRLTIGVQSFSVNGKQESEEHAQWTASMLRKALDNAASPPSGDTATVDAKDAQRYRWLREQDWNDGTLCVVENPRASVKLGYDCPSRWRLDAQIDAAIEKDDRREGR